MGVQRVCAVRDRHDDYVGGDYDWIASHERLRNRGAAALSSKRSASSM